MISRLVLMTTRDIGAHKIINIGTYALHFGVESLVGLAVPYTGTFKQPSSNVAPLAFLRQSLQDIQLVELVILKER